MRLVVAGSRSFGFTYPEDGAAPKIIPEDLRIMDAVLKLITADEHIGLTIVSGTAKGADILGEFWAKANGHKIARFPAKWDLYGRRAGFIRNVEMAKKSDAVAVFWDGTSRGSWNMINITKDRKMPLWLWDKRLQRLWYYEGHGSHVDLTKELDSVNIPSLRRNNDRS